jgi:hypothetical protein
VQGTVGRDCPDDPSSRASDRQFAGFCSDAAAVRIGVLIANVGPVFPMALFDCITVFGRRWDQ